MERKIKKAIITFFILMLFLTIASRAAASVITARVQVDNIKSGRLAYKLSGIGTIRENSKKYIDLHSGYKVGEVLVKSGQKVEKGALLFSYDMEQLNEKKNALENDLKKLQLQYQSLSLSGHEDTLSHELEDAQINLNIAREDLKDAEASLEEKKNKILEEIEKQNNTDKEKKEEEYKAAALEWEDIDAAGKEAVMKAQRIVSDAEGRLLKLKEPLLLIESLIASYHDAVVSADEEMLQEAQNNIYELYYNGKYNEHLAEVADAEKELDRAQEDLNYTLLKWSHEIEWWEYYISDNAEVQKKILNYNIEKQGAERAVEDARLRLERLTEKDKLLKDALGNYRAGIEGQLNVQEGYEALYRMLNKASGIDETAINAAATELERAREDEALISSTWQEKLNQATEKKDALFEELIAFEALRRRPLFSMG